MSDGSILVVDADNVSLKYPENTASLVFKGDANDMIKTAEKLRNK